MRIARLPPLISHPVARAPLTMSVDVSEIVDCVMLKSLLIRHLDALQVLVQDLYSKAREAERETHPSLDASVRFRRSFDATFRLYLHAAPRESIGSDPGVRDTVTQKIEKFLEIIAHELPRVDRTLVSAEEYNWPMRFERASNHTMDLANQLTPF